MAKELLVILILICIGLLGWGIVRLERIYQFPFFMGAMFISFIVPQGFALINNPGPVSQIALERVLLMSCLCAACCWLGYQVQPNRKWLNKLDIKIDAQRLYKAGIALMIMSYGFNFLAAGKAKEFEGSSEPFSGPVTIYLFLGSAIYIAFVIFLLETLKRPTLINLMFTLMSGWIPLQAVIGGRRQPTMTFIIIIGFSFWIIRRMIPPRWLVVISVLSLIFLIPAIGQLRGDFWNLLFTGQWYEVFSTTQRKFEDLQGGSILELRNASLFMDAVEKKSLYGFGSGWWDRIVFQYFPGQILGYGLKKSIQFNLIEENINLADLYGYVVPSGTTITGVGDSFLEFGYLGCLFFALFAYIFRHLWISSVYQKSVLSILLSVVLISSTMVGLTHGLGRFWQEAVFKILCVSLIIYYSRSENSTLKQS